MKMLKSQLYEIELSGRKWRQEQEIESSKMKIDGVLNLGNY